MTYQEFYNKYKGQKDVGNTAGNRGQCVGLVMAWIQKLGLSTFWGDAKDLYKNAKDEDFEKIPNTPTAIPQQGDIIVWQGEFNGGAGHTGIATGKADVNTFECFEQNDPIGSTPHLKTYNYAYITGWLRPKKTAIDVVSVPKDTFEGLVRKGTAYDEVCGFLKLDKLSTTSGNIINAFEKLKDELQNLRTSASQTQDKLEAKVSELTQKNASLREERDKALSDVCSDPNAHYNNGGGDLEPQISDDPGTGGNDTDSEAATGQKDPIAASIDTIVGFIKFLWRVVIK